MSFFNASEKAAIAAVRKANTVEEAFDALGVSPVSPEAYFIELVWVALKDDEDKTLPRGNF